MTDSVDTDLDPLERLGRVGVVPVVTITEAGTAADLTTALVDGGLDVVEITLRTPDAFDALAAAATTSATVGAGTVLSEQQATAAIEAGARFLVSPGLDPRVVATGHDRNVPVIPGVATPTELMQARSLGVDTVKLFPAAALGGPAFVRALAAVWPSVRFVPTGGISAVDAPAYLATPGVAAVGGSWMIDPDAVADRRWSDVRDAAAAARALGADRR